MERPVYESSNKSSVLAFLSGLWLGRRRRNSGISILILLVSVCACISGFTMVFLGVPFTFYRSREAASLPRPDSAQLQKLAPGTHVLVTAQIPPDAPTGPYELSLFYVEAAKERNSEQGQATRSSNTSEWEIVEPPPPRFEMLLRDQSPISVQFPAKRNLFLNAESFNEEAGSSRNDTGRNRRYIGYLAGQNLTIEGRWEGNGLFTADASYAGTPDDYVSYLRNQIGLSFLMGMMCGGIGFVLLIVGGFLRFIGR